MAFLADFWLPILLSGVLVFVVSSVLHMVVPLHKGDWRKLPDEDKLLATLREQGAGAGSYMFPRAASMKDTCSPEMLAKFQQGPVGHLVLIPPGAPRMGKALGQWFLYTLVVGAFVAYVVSHASPALLSYGERFRIAGTAAVLGYALGCVPDSIWKGQSWRVTLKFVFDGVLYGLVTAGAFAGLWPS